MKFIKLLIREIEDKFAQENFLRLDNFIKETPLLIADFQHVSALIINSFG